MILLISRSEIIHWWRHLVSMVWKPRFPTSPTDICVKRLGCAKMLLLTHPRCTWGGVYLVLLFYLHPSNNWYIHVQRHRMGCFYLHVICYSNEISSANCNHRFEGSFRIVHGNKFTILKMHMSHIPQCTISYHDVLWDICLIHCRICEIGLLWSQHEFSKW